MKPVLGLGNALVDILVQMKDDTLIQKLNLPKGSMTMIDEDQAKNIQEILSGVDTPKASGGSAANTIHGIAKLGNSCGYIGKINTDDFGDFFKSDLEQAGIKSKLFIGNAATGRANTFISTDSERTFATYLGAAVEMLADELTPELFDGYEILHIEGYLIFNEPLVEKAFQLAKANNMLISLDLASYNVVEVKLDFLKRIIPEFVDIVFANEEEAKAYTSKEPEEALHTISEQCEIAVVKVGKDGSMVKSGGKVHHIGIVETKPIDTTGAGDQYAAGFLYGLNLGLSHDKCGELGALLAGKVIEKYGARIYEEDWSEILNKARAIND